MKSKTTITVSSETKTILASLKGDSDWDSFLRKLALKYYFEKMEKNFEKLREIEDEEGDRRLYLSLKEY